MHNFLINLPHWFVLYHRLSGWRRRLEVGYFPLMRKIQMSQSLAELHQRGLNYKLCRSWQFFLWIGTVWLGDLEQFYPLRISNMIRWSLLLSMMESPPCLQLSHRFASDMLDYWHLRQQSKAENEQAFTVHRYERADTRVHGCVHITSLNA